MTYSLLLFQVPPGTTDDDVEKIAARTMAAEDARRSSAPDPDKDHRKGLLVDALLNACPELKGGPPDYADLARAENISEAEARRRFHWWTVAGPEEGAGIEITLYDDYISVDMPSQAGTDEDWRDVWRYLEILVNKGGFVVWDPQAPGVVDLAGGPFGEGEPDPRVIGPSDHRPSGYRSDDDPTVEPEDIRRGGEVAALINRIVNAAIAEPLAAAGFKRTGRTWRRTLDNGLIHVVDVQWSPRDRRVEASFGLGAGVYSRELAESIALYKPIRSPKEHDCQVRLRPTAHGRRSWEVRVPGLSTPDPDLPGMFGRFFAWLDRRADRKAAGQHAKATRELREALVDAAFPALERMTTLRGVRDELARGPDLFWAAHASLLIGEREAATDLLGRALKKAVGNPEFTKLMRKWGAKQELPSP